MPELIIRHTWNGSPLSDNERVRIGLDREKAHLRLSIQAPFHNDPPPMNAPGSTDRLWEYEVVEVFFVGETGRYLEIEMGPHGHYLVLLLGDVRCVEKMHIPMAFTSLIKGKTWRGEARLALSHLPLPCIRANAFAIHGGGEKRRYLCAHPTGGEIPDFHKPALFPFFSL